MAIAEVAFGFATPVQIIQRACLPDNAPLLRIRLTKLLRSQEGWGQERTIRTLRKMMFLLDERRTRHDDAGMRYVNGNDFSHVNIAWLVDARAGGRRVLAFSEAMNDDRSAPWPGFPLAPKRRMTERVSR